MSVLLSVNNLYKSFGAVRIAHDISFDVMEGEVLGVIGPNGAGKTSLFAMLAGNLMADQGSIRFDGREISQLPAHQRTQLGIARTFQVPKPFTHMTVAENLKVAALFGGGLEEVECDDWVSSIMDMTGLGSVSHTLAGRLPLLLRKRHELARALATRPRMLLIDEVAAGLTDQEVNDFIHLVMDVRDSGITVVWIEHVMKTMLTATNRLLAVSGGDLLALGEPDEVINSPEVRRVYLGE